MKQLSDLTSPTSIVRKLLERDVQSPSVEWARKRGLWARKFSSISQRSVPDYLFAGRGLKFATEFKAPGKTSTDAQLDEQTAMRNAGWTVFECDSFEAFKLRVIALEKGE